MRGNSPQPLYCASISLYAYSLDNALDTMESIIAIGNMTVNAINKTLDYYNTLSCNQYICCTNMLYE